MIAQEITVGEDPGVFLESISGGDQDEVTTRAAGGGRVRIGAKEEAE